MLAIWQDLLSTVPAFQTPNSWLCSLCIRMEGHLNIHNNSWRHVLAEMVTFQLVFKARSPVSQMPINIWWTRRQIPFPFFETLTFPWLNASCYHIPFAGVSDDHFSLMHLLECDCPWCDWIYVPFLQGRTRVDLCDFIRQTTPFWAQPTVQTDTR